MQPKQRVEVSLINYFIGDSFVEAISCFNGDSFFKTDHKAIFLVLNNKVFYKSKPTTKTIYDKSNYSAEQFQKLLEQSDWISFYSCDNAEGRFKEFVLNVSTVIEKCAPLKKFSSGTTKIR